MNKYNIDEKFLPVPITESRELVDLEGRSLEYTGEEDILSRYELGERIAAGGQGLLRRAVRKSDGRDVVVKKYSQMEDIDWDVYDSEKVGAAP